MQPRSPKKYKYGIMLMLKSTIVIFAIVAFVFCLILSYKEVMFPERGNIVLALLYFFILFTMLVTYNCFKIGKVRMKELSFSYFISLIMTNFFSYLVLSLIGEAMLNPVPLLILTLIQFLFGLLIYLISISVYSSLFEARDALLICGKSDYDYSVINKFKNEYKRFNIKQIINQNYDLKEIEISALKYSTMIIENIDKDLKSKLVEFCFVNDIQLYIVPTINDIIMQGTHYTNVDDTILLFGRNQALTPEQRFVKRAFDVFVSLVLLIVTSPIMLITAVLIKLYDKGPVFFRQERYTYDGKIFTLIKFRSMITDAEKNGAQFTINNDPRVTPIGRIIRAYRIDELPQLFNILFGDMSLVGPRAERVENVEKYSSIMPEFNYRFKVKTGLTGYAQLYGKYNTSFEDKARMDIYYIVNYSLLLDLKLLFYTLKIIFSKESTDGFPEGANEEAQETDKLPETANKN